MWLLRRVLAAVAWTRGGPSARRQAAGMDFGSPRRGPCIRHSSGSLQVSTCESSSSPGGDSLGIRVSCEEKWVDPRVMDTKEGRGSYETDEGGDQRNHFHSGWTLSLEPWIEQLHEGNHEGEGFPHTQDWPSRLLEVMQPVVNVKEWQRVSCRMGVTCWEMDLLEEQILNVRDRVDHDWPEEERLFDVEEEFERVPDGEQGCVSGKFQGTMEELVGLLEQMHVVQRALGGCLTPEWRICWTWSVERIGKQSWGSCGWSVMTRWRGNGRHSW